VVVAVGDRKKIEPELQKLDLGPIEVRDMEGNPAGNAQTTEAPAAGQTVPASRGCKPKLQTKKQAAIARSLFFCRPFTGRIVRQQTEAAYLGAAVNLPKPTPARGSIDVSSFFRNPTSVGLRPAVTSCFIVPALPSARAAGRML
jgi:hypothetical protein